MSRSDAVLQYRAALKHGIKYYQSSISQGKNPYPPVLDDIVNETQISGQQVIGTVEVPLSLVAGTLAAGRKSAFAADFSPLLSEESEFAQKWISLCHAQLDEGGIRDAIKCIEFMGRFYVIEGNKRVSVLKSFGAATITADVTRSVPVWSDTPEIKAYYEFMRFNKITGMYLIQFREPGKFERLLKKLGKTWDSSFDRDEVMLLQSLALRFENAVDQRIKSRLPEMQACDIMLECLEVYSFDELMKADTPRLQKMILAILPDLEINPVEEAETHISTQPGMVDKNIVRQLLDDLSRPDALHIAFIYTAPPDSSEWAAAHDDGRRMLEEAFENQITVRTYVTSHDNADAVLETAVDDGAQVIFITAPVLMGPARRIAALHPGLKVLVCALSVPYSGIRTYYARVYEAKFVLGAIAGALCEGEPIGCVARYPILGVPAAINAFALGARLTCPNARILLEWTCLPGDPYQSLTKAGARIITSQPGALPALRDGSGLFQVKDGKLTSLAYEVWNWGRMYQKIVRSILDGGWEQEEAAPSVNYWWGMNGGVINVKLREGLPEGTVHLANILRNGLSGDSIHPFMCTLRDQAGVTRLDGESWLTPIEIMHMNWLGECVSGILPKPDEVLEMSKETTRLLALPVSN